MSAWPSHVAIACDHAAPSLKNEFVAELERHGCTVLDYGTNEGCAVDYPDMGRVVGEAVRDGRAERGIVLCGSGIGISIACNKVHGVRCALCHDRLTAELCRQHNDANVMAVGARTTGPLTALDMLRTFMTTEFEGGRHQRRVDMIHEIEKAQAN